jgi:uncharacterized damage-inducible protein DinB
MPGSVSPVSNESEALVAYLAQQRYLLRLTSYGLTDEQARATPTTSALSVGGVIKHVAAVERFWMDVVMARVDRPDARTETDYQDNFRIGPDETLESVLGAYAESASATDATVESIDDMAYPVPIPRSVPWFPKDVDTWSLRWVLLHLTEETARHAGHADIVREAIDGGTGFAIMAAAEKWPATPWLEPWKPSGAQIEPPIEVGTQAQSAAV